MSGRSHFISSISTVLISGLCLSGGPVLAGQPPVEPPTTAPQDAAQLYAQAAKAIVADCPGSSNDVFPGYPPFGKEWDQLAQTAWDKNAAARQLARQARSVDHANWSAVKQDGYWNSLRALANELGDASLYQHFHGDDAGAGETIQDMLHLTALMYRNPDKNNLVRMLVADGIDALTASRGLVIASAVKLTTDPSNTHDLQVATARRLIDELLNQQTAADPWKKILDPRVDQRLTEESIDRIKETINRVNGERTFLAMSLACHVFRFEKNRWPQSLKELVPAYLPRVLIDPWGDGKQTFGYALIKGGLPDGWDRPLVYSRCWSPDGLFYRTDEPEYGFYNSDGSKLPNAQQKHGGQFRDVTVWTPEPEAAGQPTTHMLNRWQMERDTRLSSIHVATMADVDHHDDQAIIVDGVNDSIIADANAVGIFAGELNAAGRARIGG
jgi:hypothetical protein